MTLRQEIIEKYNDFIDKLPERVGETPKEVLLDFILSTVIPMVIEKITPEEEKFPTIGSKWQYHRNGYNQCRQSILSKLKDEGLSK